MNTIIQNIRTNIMGTISFELKAKGHRGFQDFIVYPKSGGDDSSDYMIQSDKRIGYYNPPSGKMILSKSKANAGYINYSIDKVNKNLTAFEISEKDNLDLKLAILGSASPEAGKRQNGGIQSDNSGAINIIG